MLQYGINITQPADMLHPLDVAELARRIQQPKPAIKNAIEQLRVLKTLDKGAYNAQKKLLPYIVCGIFKPAIRRREHLVSISHFMIDLDGVATHFDIAELRRKLCADAQVALLFISPGGDGIKLMFHLQKPCTDAGLYAAFYKLFVAAFAARYSLHAVIDRVTSDATRACFISADEEAFYNPAAEAVNLEAICGNTPDALWQAQTAAEIQFAEQKTEEAGRLLPEGGTEKAVAKGLAADVLLAIRQRLNPHARRPAPEKLITLSQQVDRSLDKIVQHLQNLGMEVPEMPAINYGRKLKVTAGGQWAEVNIFYGKRGFSLVATPKSGSNPQLAQLATEALQEIMHTLDNV